MIINIYLFPSTTFVTVIFKYNIRIIDLLSANIIELRFGLPDTVSYVFGDIFIQDAFLFFEFSTVSPQTYKSNF